MNTQRGLSVGRLLSQLVAQKVSGNEELFYLRAHVFNCTTHAHFDSFAPIQIAGEAEINNPQVVIIFAFGKHNIEGFDV